MNKGQAEATTTFIIVVPVKTSFVNEILFQKKLCCVAAIKIGVITHTLYNLAERRPGGLR